MLGYCWPNVADQSHTHQVLCLLGRIPWDGQCFSIESHAICYGLPRRSVIDKIKHKTFKLPYRFSFHNESIHTQSYDSQYIWTSCTNHYTNTLGTHNVYYHSVTPSMCTLMAHLLSFVHYLVFLFFWSYGVCYRWYSTHVHQSQQATTKWQPTNGNWPSFILDVSLGRVWSGEC